jgi:hypothetical protein
MVMTVATDMSEDTEQEEEVSAFEQVNILPLLLKNKPEWTSKQAKRVIQTALDDNESRADYMKKYANQLKLFAGVVPTLGYPAQGAKAPAIMLMCKAILHTWARMCDQVIPAKGDYVKSKPLGPKDQPRALRTERHMNWQLRYRMPDWASSHQVSIIGFLMGSTFRHYRWDPIEHTHAVDHVPIDDIIVAYTETDVSPQMKHVDRVTRVMRLAKWELELYAARGHYSNLEAIFPEGDTDGDEGSSSDGDVIPTASSDEDSPVREAADKIQGLERPTKKDKYSKREIYEQHTTITFPEDLGVEGLDGETKPVVIVVDKQTKKPLAVTIREEPDPVDQARFNDEVAAFEQAAMNAGDAPLGMIKPPRQVRMRTVYRIFHYGLFPNPSGFYRMGLASLLESSNELANTLAAEYMLSAKFYNLFCGFLARDTKQKEGDIQMSQGRFIRTELEAEVLDKGIKVMEGRPPAEALMKIVEKLEENAEIGASVDILSGEKGSSNETARGMMIRNSQAMALISVMTRLYLEPMKYELKMIAHGNSIYLDEFEYFPFTEDIPGSPGMQEVKNEKVFRQDYVEDVHLEFTADSRMISKPERIAEAKDAIGLAGTIPFLAQNPMFMHFAVQQYFIVAEMTQYIPAMGPPPKPAPPPTPESQEVENAGFFNEKDHPVLPDDNHALHMHKIEELRINPLFEKMSSTGKQMLDRHERAHAAAIYQQLQALQEETGVNIHAMAAQGAAGGMGPGRDGPGVQGPPRQMEGGGGEAPPNGRPTGDFGGNPAG